MQRSFGIAIILSLLLLFSMASCCKRQKATDDGQKIMETERHYSTLSSEKGMNAAFIAMFDSNGVLLRNNHMPIEGISAIKDLLLSEEDSTFSLTWEPLKAIIAQSGELGYSYGTYIIKSRTTGQQISEGTYATVWKKNANGEWKAMLDTGNHGLKKPPADKQ
jgi:ketosteroid isomerase-like protein